jgi:hypothetical protein
MRKAGRKVLHSYYDLSVNWLENLAPLDRPEQVAEVLRVLSTKRSVKASAKLALMNVGAARAKVQAGTDTGREIHFLHEPEEGPHEDPSHSGIYNLPFSDTDIAAAELLALSITEIFPAR